MSHSGFIALTDHKLQASTYICSVSASYDNPETQAQQSRTPWQWIPNSTNTSPHGEQVRRPAASVELRRPIFRLEILSTFINHTEIPQVSSHTRLPQSPCENASHPVQVSTPAFLPLFSADTDTGCRGADEECENGV